MFKKIQVSNQPMANTYRDWHQFLRTEIFYGLEIKETPKMDPFWLMQSQPFLTLSRPSKITFFLNKMLLISNTRHVTLHWLKQNKYEGVKLNTGACCSTYRNYYRLHSKISLGNPRGIPICGQNVSLGKLF